MIKKLPWLRSLKKTDPEVPVQLPILCDATSNGEGWWPDSERKQLIRKLVLEKADEVSRREGIDRREFLASACGTATALYMINLVNGCSSGKDPAPNNVLGMGGSGGNSGSGGGSGMGGGGSGMGGMGGGGMGGGGMGGGVSGEGGMGGGGSGGTGGFNMPECAMEDIEIAECALGMGGNELVIDMQSHFANTETNPTGASFLNSFIGPIDEPGRFPWIVRTEGCRVGNDVTACLDRIEFINQILMGSPTTIAVLSGISYTLGAQGGDEDALFAVLTNTDLIDGVQKLEADFPRRMLSHAMVMPNDRLDVQLDMMTRLSNQYTNWKTYPPWTGSNAAGIGYWLDGPEGQAMLSKGVELGSPIFCIHKGFPLSSFSPTYTDPKDVGPAAKMFPDAHFVIYHSAFEHGLQSGDSTAPFMSTETAWGPGVGQWPEGPYDESLEEDEAAATSQEKGGYPLNRGVNSLIWSLRKAGIGPNGTCIGDNTIRTNVYAECGGVWPNLMTGRVEEAMHYWGKLLKYIGEDRIVWGTDCLWFGSPKPLIEGFRAFEISQEFQDTYGYPALTQARKEKILGQNAARLQNIRLAGTDAEIKGCHSDYVSAANLKLQRELDEEWGPRRDMQFAYRPGPRTRREFLKLRAHEHAEKLRWSGRFPNRVKV